MKIIWACCLILLYLYWGGAAEAGELSEKLANFERWEKLTSVQPAVGDLVYPEWMEGDWEVKSTLSDLAAPLAPDIVTPGFEGNRQYLNKPISFKVRFVKSKLPAIALKAIPTINSKSVAVVADRAFNGLNLARAYLSDAVLSVKVDPKTPNRQITFCVAIASLFLQLVDAPQKRQVMANSLEQKSFNKYLKVVGVLSLMLLNPQLHITN